MFSCRPPQDRFHVDAALCIRLHPNITLLNAPASEFDRFWYHGFVVAGDYTYDRQSVFSGLQRAIGKPEAGRVYVLSEENISGHTYSGWNAARNAERLRDLVSGCRIFLVIRNQAAYIGSAYVNYVNQGGALGQNHPREERKQVRKKKELKLSS